MYLGRRIILLLAYNEICLNLKCNSINFPFVYWLFIAFKPWYRKKLLSTNIFLAFYKRTFLRFRVSHKLGLREKWRKDFVTEAQKAKKVRFWVKIFLG